MEGSSFTYCLQMFCQMNTFAVIPETFNVLFTEVSLVKNFLVLKSFPGTCYSVGLINSSAKQSREQLHSNRCGTAVAAGCFPLGTATTALHLLA